MKTTIKELAKITGVSVATISRVLNNSSYVKDETREKVMKTIKELNYTPNAIARSLSQNRTNTIGVLIPDIQNPFFGDVIKGISTVTEENGLSIILCDTNEDVEKELQELQNLKENRIQGIIITPTSDENQFNNEYLNALENMGIPTVLVDRDVKYSNFDGVFIDNIRGAYEATELLIKEGHRDIAIITGPITSKPGRERLDGYKKAHMKYNIKVNDDNVFIGDFKLNCGYESTIKILAMKKRPTAIFVCNNMMHLGCIKALNEQGVNIPEDIALVAFDEIEILNFLGIKITVVSRPTVEMGKVAAEILIDKLSTGKSSEGQTKKVILSPKLIIRGSEKCFKL